jgi:hypothetical protein
MRYRAMKFSSAMGLKLNHELFLFIDASILENTAWWEVQTEHAFAADGQEINHIVMVLIKRMIMRVNLVKICKF